VTGVELQRHLGAGADTPLVLDVRSAFEFRRGHVPTAVHMPFWLLPFGAARITPVGARQIVVYCGHGPRAWWAGAWLRRMRRRRAWTRRAVFVRVEYLDGHWARWRREERPVEK
jgi:rhodanese-related sulfurtransferase